jgi:hypothetical protein
MPYYWNTGIFWSSWGGGGNPAPWTVDMNMPPSSVYGLSSLTYHRHGGGNSGADVGFLRYVTQDPDTGAHSEHVTSAFGGTFSGWLAPNILDENVITVTIAWNCYSEWEVLPCSLIWTHDPQKEEPVFGQDHAQGQRKPA